MTEQSKFWSSKKMTAALFNERYPVGTKVRYFPVSNESGFVESKTRTPAWELGHGAAVVSIEGRSGGVLVQALKVQP